MDHHCVTRLGWALWAHNRLGAPRQAVAPTLVQQLLTWVLAPCTMHGSSYHRQEAEMGWYNTMHHREPLRP